MNNLPASVMTAIEQALRDGRATESGKPRLPFREYPVKDLCKRPPKPLVAPSVKLTITVPCVVVSELNSGRGNGIARWRRFKKQGKAVELVLMAYNLKAPPVLEPVTITLTRIGGQPMDGHDNLRCSFKGIADFLSKWLQCDDGDSRLTWEYKQEPGKVQGVVITVEPTLPVES